MSRIKCAAGGSRGILAMPNSAACSRSISAFASIRCWRTLGSSRRASASKDDKGIPVPVGTVRRLDAISPLYLNALTQRLPALFEALTVRAQTLRDRVQRSGVEEPNHRHPVWRAPPAATPPRAPSSEMNSRRLMCFLFKPGLAAYQKCRVVHHSTFRRSMSQLGHSRRGRLLPVVGRLPQCPESGRKVRASASVAMCRQRTSVSSIISPARARSVGPVARAATGVRPRAAWRPP